MQVQTLASCPSHPWNVAEGKWDMMAETWSFPSPDLGWNPACLLAAYVSGMWLHSLSCSFISEIGEVIVLTS